MKRMGMARGLVAVLAAVSIAGACTSTASPGASGGANAKYTIGFTNPGGVGNGWREAMLCSAKVQAVKAGNVTKVTIIHRDTDAPGQLADIRTLIAQGVNAIIINPAGPDALNPAIAEAIDWATEVTATTRRPRRRAPRAISTGTAVVPPAEKTTMTSLGPKAKFERMTSARPGVRSMNIACRWPLAPTTWVWNVIDSSTIGLNPG